MTGLRTLTISTAASALIAGAGPSFAEVTANDVWNDLKAGLAIYGENGLSIGAEEAGEGILTIRDLTLTMAEGDESVVATIEQLVFTELGDGTVQVDMPENYPIRIASAPEDYVVLDVSQKGMNLIVSGDPGDLAYDISIDRYSFTVSEAIEFGEPLFEGDIFIAMNGVAGTYSSTIDGELRNLTYDIGAASVDLLADITEPSGEGTVLASGKIDALQFKLNGDLPSDITASDPENVFANGLDLAMAYGFGGASMLFDFKADGDEANGTIALGGTLTDISMNGDALKYEVAATDIAVTMASSDLPVPVEISIGEIGTGLAMPLSTTEEPVSFSASFVVDALDVNDEIWGLGDPEGVLPRDPITARIAFEGLGKLFFDLTDPNQANALAQSDVPGELYEIKTTDFLISAVGAALSGSGGFTFDNSDLDTFDGLPRPLGEARVNLKGGNQLIDSLVAMGLLPEDQASMARLGMGMFARNVGDDELETKVEVNAEGHLIVNDQRMR